MRLTRSPAALLILAVLTLTGCDAINFGLRSEPGEEFRLGENQHGAFTASVRNEGPVPVTLLIEDGEGQRTSIATIEPGAAAEEQFGAGAIAVLANDSSQLARLAVRITGDTDLSMGYAPR